MKKEYFVNCYEYSEDEDGKGKWKWIGRLRPGGSFSFFQEKIFFPTFEEAKKAALESKKERVRTGSSNKDKMKINYIIDRDTEKQGDHIEV